MNTNSSGERNVNMLVEISAWVAGYLMGSDPKMCMEHITKAMQREGYVPEMKRKHEPYPRKGQIGNE